MIARRENVFARNLDQAGKFGQGRAFVIIGVAKPEINRVALIVKLRFGIAGPLNELNNAVHFRLVFGPQTFEPLGVIKQLRSRLLSDEIDNLGQSRLGRRK